MSAPFARTLRLAFLAVPTAWLLASSPAFGCDASIVQAPAPVTLDYDPFAFTRAPGRLSFEVENRDAVECAVDIALLESMRIAVADIDVAQTGVRVSITAGSGDAVLAPTSVPGIWNVRLQPGTRVKLALNAMVSHDAISEAGEHAAALTMELRDAGANVALSAAAPVRIVLTSLPRAQMNIAGAAGTFGDGPGITSVDFGVLDGEAVRRVFLQVRSNTQARLTIASQNLGRLLLVDAPPNEEGVVYQAQLAGEIVDLTKPWQQVFQPPRTIAGTSLPFDLTLGSIGAHAAGVYTDTLTIVLSGL